MVGVGRDLKDHQVPILCTMGMGSKAQSIQLSAICEGVLYLSIASYRVWKDAGAGCNTKDRKEMKM